MSNETDLDWLARNVPLDQLRGWVQKAGKGFNIIPSGMPPTVLGQPEWFSAREVLARREELHNKPSWKDAPAWAEFLIQTLAGVWIWISHEPNCMDDNGVMYFHPDAESGKARDGEVLGDWRDTLEKRPEQDEFETLTSIEENQEKAMKQDNGWHERGELPPVGVECEIRHSCWNSEKYEKVTVAAITKEYLIVKYATFEQHYMLKDISFRPLRTERDKLVELIKTYRHTFRSDTEFADAILAAGFRRGGAA